MTVQLDSPQGNTAAQQSSVWNQPQQDPLAIFNPAVEGPNEVATVDQRHVDANGRRDLATETDGNASKTGTPEPTPRHPAHPLFAHNPGNTTEVQITRPPPRPLNHHPPPHHH